MNQTTRNKIALVFSVVLVPTMIYLMVTNIRKARELRHRLPSSAAVAPQPDVSPPAAPPAQPAPMLPLPPPPTTEPTADEKVVNEQRRIAALLPTRDPFHRTEMSGLSTNSTGLAQQTALPIEVTGIIIGKTPNNRMAIINGKMLEEGAYVAGYKIIAIGTSDVTLVNGTNSLTVSVKR
jgi:general secretion pathway protein B